MATGNPIDVVLAQLERPRQIPGGGWQARCPVPSHGKQRGDRNPSLTVTEGIDGKVLLHCHTGCNTDAVLGAIGLKKSDLFPRNGTPAAGNGKMHIVAAYGYRDETGGLLHEVVRLDPKDFRQRRPDGKGGWLWNVGNTRKVLFRLPELLAADPAEPVFVVEGEKDVLTLVGLGLIATTNAGGAGKWRSEYSECLRDRHVVLLPDNDVPGKNHAQRVAGLLLGVASSIKVVELPGLTQAGDVSDWLAAAGTREGLLQLVAEALEWKEPPRLDPIAGPTLPSIIINSRPMRDVTTDALEALKAHNEPPLLFERGGQLCRVRRDERARPVIDTVTENVLRGMLERSANYVMVTDEGVTRPVAPPLNVVRDMAALPQWGFPPLEAVIETPVLRADGTLLDTPGYDARTRLFYAPQEGFRLPEMPEDVTSEYIEVALRILASITEDFPSVDDASRANTLALFLTPVIHPVIDGTVPMALIDAPEKGTGKSLLAKVGAMIATGNARVMGGPQREEEFQKLITAELAAGSTYIILDNLRGTLRSASLERALTSTHLRERVLGATLMIDLPQRATWVATANNVDLSGDLARRCYWIRLDAKLARPWEGREFTFPDLLGTVRQQRGDLLWALLLLARAWFVAGCPKADVRVLGGFEGWSRTVGSILAHAKVPGFLSNLDEMYDALDDDGAQWEGFLRAIQEKFGGKTWSVSTLIAGMNSENLPGPEGKTLQESLPDDLREAYAGDREGRGKSGFTKRLGIALKRHKDKRYGPDGIHLVATGRESRSRTVLWTVAEEQKSQKSRGA